MQVLADANREFNTTLHRSLPLTQAMRLAHGSRAHVAAAVA